MKVEISLIFVAIASCSGDDTQDGSYKKAQGGFDFHNQDKSFSYNGTVGSYVIDDSSGNYKFNKQEGEFPLNGATFSGTNTENRLHNNMPDSFNGFQAGNFGWNAADGSSARGHGHPHIPRSNPNWGVQHFHFANGPHPFHELFRQMSNPQLNMYQHIPVPYPQMGQPPQMSVPHPQIQQPPQMSVPQPQIEQPPQMSVPHPQFEQPPQMPVPHPQMEQPPQMSVPHPQVEQFKQLTTATEKEPQNKQENAWAVDSIEDEEEINDSQPDGRLG